MAYRPLAAELPLRWPSPPLPVAEDEEYGYECELCGEDHGDGLTCQEVEDWERDMAREEEEMMDAPWRELRAWEASRIWLVRVGDRVYYSDDTERITRRRLVLEHRRAWGRREAALRLWFAVGVDIEAALAPVPAAVAAAPAAPAAAALPRRCLERLSPDSRPVGTTGEAAPVPVTRLQRREWVVRPRK